MSCNWDFCWAKNLRRFFLQVGRPGGWTASLPQGGGGCLQDGHKKAVKNGVLTYNPRPQKSSEKMGFTGTHNFPYL